MNATDEEAYLKLISEFIDISVLSSICIVGCILNLINFVVFIDAKFNAAPYSLLTAMSLVDSITLLMKLIESLIRVSTFEIISNPYLKVGMYLFILYVGVPLSNMTESISNWTAVALATERYIAMRHYNISKLYFTVDNIRYFLLISSLISILFNSPFFYTVKCEVKYELDSSTNTTVPTVLSDLSELSRSSFYTVYSWLRPVIIQFIPLMFLCICNFLLITLVFHHRTKQQNHFNKNNTHTSTRSTNEQIRQQRKQRAQQKLTILLIVVILLFLIGQIPIVFSYFKIANFVFNYQCKKYQFISTCPLYFIYHLISNILMSFCYTMNFFVYLSLNKHFRKTLRTYMRNIFLYNHCIGVRNSNINLNQLRFADQSILLNSITPNDPNEFNNTSNQTTQPIQRDISSDYEFPTPNQLKQDPTKETIFSNS